MVEEMLAARGIEVSHETVRQWALKLGQNFATRSADVFRRLETSGTWTVCHEHISEGGDVELYKR